MSTSELFVSESRRYLRDVYLPAIRKAVNGLPDAQVWWRPDEGSNSIGNLLLHLSGNVRQWIVSGLGGEPDTRTRQAEFDARGALSTAEVVERLALTVADADRVLLAFPVEALSEVRHIQGRETGAYEAIYHVVEHFSGHTGQIVWLAKALRSGALGRPS